MRKISKPSRFALLFGISFIGAFLGCSNSPQPILINYERQLGIHGETSREFHLSLYYPKGIALKHPGYLIGFQKAMQTKVKGPAVKFPEFLNPSPGYFKNERGIQFGLGSLDILGNLENHPKTLYVHHVTHYQYGSYESEDRSAGGRHPHLESCQIYNAFDSPSLFPDPEGATQQGESKGFHLSGALAWNKCGDAPDWGNSTSEFMPGEFYANGVLALNSLSKSVAEDIKKDAYTHLLILVMGWNTPQENAVRNFNDIAGNLIEASRESNSFRQNDLHSGVKPFKPLVIGISWPSFWPTPGVSYQNKASDADELGISWMNLLINREIPKALEDNDIQVPVILIGHSLGARAASRTAAASPALKQRASEKPAGLHTGANLIIGLQGAFSLNRFWPDSGGKPVGMEGAPLREFRILEKTRFALVASKHDSATGFPFWMKPAGSISAFEATCKPPQDKWKKDAFHCLSANDTMTDFKQSKKEGFRICELSDAKDCRYAGDRLNVPNDKILYIDASDGITEFNSPGTAGGAHSDIYRLPMGRLLWMLIDSLAPGFPEDHP